MVDNVREQQQLSDDDFILEARLHPDQEPVKSVVVGDNRNHFGKRLGLMALAMLVLFFSINGYIQSAENNRLLDMARSDRTNLVKSVGDLTEVTRSQNRYILRLQRAIREQNGLLRKLNLPTVPVPEPDFQSSKDISDADTRKVPQESTSGDSPDSEPPSSRDSGPKRDRKPDRDPRPQPEPPPEPRPKPTPDPPRERPIRDILNETCDLTGICLKEF